MLTPAVTIYAGTDFLTGERVDGLQKICFYRGPRGASAITIRSTALCPLSQTDPMVPVPPAPPAPRVGLDPSIPLSIQPPVFGNPFEQLAAARARQQQQQLLDQQIALNAAALAAPPPPAQAATPSDGFFQIALEVIADKQRMIDDQATVIKIQADEIATLKRQLAATVAR